MEFEFGAVFTLLLTIPLQAPSGERLAISDLLPTASGRFWVADAAAAKLRVYTSRGEQRATLDRHATGVRRPVSLAALQGRWIAVLDGQLPSLVILDEAGRELRRFPLPELDRPHQVCNLGDRWLAVVGSGWGPGSGRLVHLYTTGGEYVESLFGEPREAERTCYAFAAAAGSALYLGHSRTDSFAIYDVDARAVLSFPNLASRYSNTAVQRPAAKVGLRGLFATSCGPLLAMSGPAGDACEFRYDLYSLDGTPVALGVGSSERVMGVEGSLFYSVKTAGGETVLNVWKLKYGNGSPMSEAVAPGWLKPALG